jgi:DNA-binding transcriptional regulator YbjK
MAKMTAAVTPKGERRRYALVRAAAELLCEGGFEAVRHRAVADRAGLPLASTTYYFSSLEVLIEAAVDHLGTTEVASLRARVQDLPRRRRPTGMSSSPDTSGTSPAPVIPNSATSNGGCGNSASPPSARRWPGPAGGPAPT